MAQGKRGTKAIDLNSNLITLNVNGLNKSLKIQKYHIGQREKTKLKYLMSVGNPL